MILFLTALALYYALIIVGYWIPLWAVMRRPEPVLPPDLPATADRPRLIVVAPCRNGAPAIPGMAACLKAQQYPSDRYSLLILVDSEDVADPTPEIAKKAGAEVYLRLNSAVRTKGAALNELFAARLRNENWDGVIVLDIDVRVAPNFLDRVAAYLAQGAQVIQGAQRAKNPDDSPISRINHAAQLQGRIAQEGRARLGLPAILCGGGMVFSRGALEKLQWKTSTGDRLSDDGELNLRCTLADIFVTYGADLQVNNEVPKDLHSTELQRRRWFACYIQMLSYVPSLLLKAFSGRPASLEKMISLMFIPSCSLSYVLGSLTVGLFAGLSVFQSRWIPWLGMAALLWSAHTAYYLAASRHVGGLLGWQEYKSLPRYLGMRFAAVFEGTILACSPNAGRYAAPARPKEEDS